jgi:addiction module RelE/StbE family toxin
MWIIFEKKVVLKTIRRAPKDVLRKYEAWKRIIELESPAGLRKVKGFHDESLKGTWKGYRSSRLGLQWRVIYKVHKGLLEVHVFKLNPHNY